MISDLEIKTDKLNNYAITKDLGAGLNSKVKQGTDILTGKEVAIKIMKGGSRSDANFKAMKTEYDVLLHLNHPNIIKLQELNDSGTYTKKDGKVKSGTVYAALELATNGEIFEYLANTGRFSEPVARFYFKQMIDALNHVHLQGFCHRDLKPENLLLDDEFNQKLADFGFAVLAAGRDGSGKLKTALGTEGYMAPEVFNRQANYHGVPNDIFSAGVIFFIFMTGVPPFKKAIPKDPFFGQLCINRHGKFWGAHEQRLKIKFSDEFKTLINSMLSYDPTHRPSITEIYASDWLAKGKTATQEQIKKEFVLRKAHVDAALERERLHKEALKEQQHRQEQEVTATPSYGFGEIKASRGNDEPGKEPVILTAENWADIATRFADTKTQERNYNSVRKGAIEGGSIIATKTDALKMYQALVWLCEQKNATVNIDKPDKMKVKATFEGDSIEMKIVFYEEEGEDGLKIAKFFKESGCICKFYEFVSEIKTEFGQLVSSE